MLSFLMRSICISKTISSYIILLITLILSLIITTKEQSTSKIFCIYPNQIPVTCPDIANSISYTLDIAYIFSGSTSSIDIVIYLVNNNYSPFYLLKQGDSSQTYYANSLTIKPYYCSNSNNQNCYNDNIHSPIIYLKTDNFNIILTNTLDISNVNIDGSDLLDQYSINSLSSNAISCLTSRILCCNIGNGNVNPYPDVICSASNRSLSFNQPVMNGLFTFMQANLATLPNQTPSVILQNMSITNVQFYYSSSFIYLDIFGTNITIINVNLNNGYFFGGFVSIQNTAGSSLCTNTIINDPKCLANITIQNSTFKGINLYNTTKSNTATIPDGYILRVNQTYSQNITIMTSIFDSMISSTISTCPVLETSIYLMNIFYMQDSKSAYGSNFLLQHALNYNPSLQSSAILIDTLNGNLTLRSNSFKSIIGYSGSVLSINGLTSIANVLITSNNFDNNFGILNGATIRIITYTSNYFLNYMCGSSIVIQNNTFTHSIGCSLSHSNILLICSGWIQDTLQNVLRVSYPTVFMETANLTTQYKNSLLGNSINAQVNIENNTFSNNYLSLSNGVVVHGYSIVFVISNVFINNSVMVENFGKVLLMNYTIGVNNQQFFKYSAFDNRNYLGSSPLYIAASSHLLIKGNIFQNNSNVFSGDLQFGSQITLRDIILLNNHSILDTNTFSYNVGLPYEIRKWLNDSVLYNGNGITLPLIIVYNYQMSNVEFLSWANDTELNLMSFTSGVNLISTNCTFSYNNFSFLFNLQNYSLNFSAPPAIASNILKTMYTSTESTTLYKISFLKLLTMSDLYLGNSTSEQWENDMIGIKFINTTFNSNLLNASQGCGLSSSWSDHLIIINSTFTNNIVYESLLIPYNGGTTFLDSASGLHSSLINYGLLCVMASQLVYKDQIIKQPRLYIQNTSFYYNKGGIINQPGTTFNISIVNIIQSRFENNTCNDTGLIFANQFSILQVSLTNFSRNHAAYGCIVGFYPSAYIGNNNKFEQNSGYVASVIFLESSSGYETNSLITSNTVGLGLQYMYFASPVAIQSAVVYIVKGTYICSYCNITENSVTASIFYVTSSRLVFQYCIFANNSYPNNSKDISAIIAFVSSTSSFICSYSRIVNNTGYGGQPKLVSIGIFVGYMSFMLFNNNTFINNPITDNLNLLYGIILSSLITNSTIQSNVIATSSSSEPILITGNFGFFNISNTTIMDSCNVMSTTAAIVNINNSQFINNNYVPHIKNEITTYVSLLMMLENVTFNDIVMSQNQTLFSAIFLNIIQPGDFIIKNTQFANLRANYGAAIYFIGTRLTLFNSTFFNLSLGTSGAGLLIAKATSVYLNSLIFNGLNGPSCHISIDNSPDLIFSLENSDFFNATAYSSIQILESNTITISNIRVIGNPLPDQLEDQYDFKQDEPALWIIKFKTVIINNSLFQNNVYGGGSIMCFYELPNATVFITNTSFISNSGLSGGAISSFSAANFPTMLIQNCSFYGNKAINGTSPLGYQTYYGKGGTIYSSCSRLMDYTCNLTIYDTIFALSKATIAGGAIYWDYFPPFNNSGLVFYNNNALYGPDIAAYPAFSLPLSSTDDGLSFKSFFTMNYDPFVFIKSLIEVTIDPRKLTLRVISGNRPKNISHVGIFDLYGQLILNDNESNLLVTPNFEKTDLFKMRITPGSIQAKGGGYNTSGLSFDYYPLRNASITAQSTGKLLIPTKYFDIIQNTNPMLTNFMRFISQATMNLSVIFEDCPIGYIFSISTANNDKYGICTLCPNGTYSLDPDTFTKLNDRKCTNCMYDMFSECSGANVLMNLGYWRMNASADIILQCTNQDYCPGGMNTTNFTKYECGFNTTGNLCDKCPAGYAKFGNDGRCNDCKQDVLYYLSLFAMLILQMLLIAYSVRCTMAESNEYDEIADKTNIQEFKSNLLKILSNYGQLLSLISGFDVTWPQEILDAFSFMSYLSFANSQYFSFECFIILGSTNLAINVLFVKLLGIFSSPIAGSIFAYAIWALIYKIKKRTIIGNKSYYNKVATSIVIIIYNLQPYLITYGFILFQCTNLYRQDKQIYYLNADYDFLCWDSNHLTWALSSGLLNILIWGIFVPLGIMWYLYKHRNELNKEHIKSKYAFIYKGYRQERFFWELLITTRKLIIITIIIFVSALSSTIQIMMGIIVIISYLILQIKYRPFNNEELNELECKSLISVGIISFITLYFQENQEHFIGITILMIGILGFGYCYFSLSWFWLFLKVIRQEINDNKQNIKKYLIKLRQYCRCLKCCRCLSRYSQKIHIFNGDEDTINGPCISKQDKIKKNNSINESSVDSLSKYSHSKNKLSGSFEKPKHEPYESYNTDPPDIKCEDTNRKKQMEIKTYKENNLHTPSSGRRNHQTFSHTYHNDDIHDNGFDIDQLDNHNDKKKNNLKTPIKIKKKLKALNNFVTSPIIELHDIGHLQNNLIIDLSSSSSLTKLFSGNNDGSPSPQ